MASQLPSSVFCSFLLQVLHPLYRLSEGQVRADELPLQAFATSVLELIQKQIGTALFLPAYQHVRAQVFAVRRARTAKRKSIALLNPQQFVQRKQQKHQHKRLVRKRKIQELKIGRKQTPTTAAGSVDASSSSHKSKKIRTA